MASVQIHDHTPIAVLGLGPTGLALAVALGHKRPVLAHDADTELVAHLQAGCDPRGEISQRELGQARQLRVCTDLAELAAAEVFIITVPPWQARTRQADLSPWLQACEQLGPLVKPGDLVIWESTPYPGAVEALCLPSLARLSGLRPGQDLAIGFSPAAPAPGAPLRSLLRHRKVTAGLDGGTGGVARLGDKLHKLALRLQTVRNIDDLYLSLVSEWQDPASLVVGAGALALLVGSRYEVAGDWFNYRVNFQKAFVDSQYADWWWSDPGHHLLEWVAMQTGWGMQGVNLMAAAVFAYGLVLFCRHLPRPWLALAVAVPYLVIILGMGYSRQGVALGCLMAGLEGLGLGRVATFVVWTLLGANFHKSAVLLLPMAALAASPSRLFTTAWVGVVLAAAYVLLLEDSVGALQAGYLEAEYQSEGSRCDW